MLFREHQLRYTLQRCLGGSSDVDPPVPIPNTEVKRFSADDTGGAVLCGK